MQDYGKSKLSNELGGNSWYLFKQYKNFFIWQYVYFALNDKKRFNILMEYMSDYTCAGSLVRQVCTVFDPDDVMVAYNFTDSSKKGIYNQKKRLKDIVTAIKNGLIDKSIYGFFDKVSHYYCEECEYTLQEEKTWRSEGLRRFSTYRYFESFEDFIKYRNGDENMDSVVALIGKPLNKYTKIQETIAAEIQKIGGSGYIHGCIIDIDYFNHVYVNPVDMKITEYWASDIIHKKVYPSVRVLLKEECPVLYARYTELRKENSNNLPKLKKHGNKNLGVLPQSYLDTDIYRVSREIKKMQKLSSNILTTWYYVDDADEMIESK